MTSPSSRGIIPELDALLKARKDEVRAWLDARFAETPPFIYSSVDLRHSGLKLAPVDTNLFPAGFNNLSPAARLRAALQFRAHVARYYPGARKIVLVPESHTRNLHYLDNLAVLASLLEQAGLEVKIGGLHVPQGETLALTSASGHAVVQHALVRRGDTLALEDGFTPDLVVLNHDLTSGAPEMLQGLSQPVTPPLARGWHRRRKSAHFAAYDQVARAFCASFGWDAWRMSTVTSRCGMVNFAEREGLECVAINVEKVLHAVRRKYEEYGIEDAPYVFIKADSGTYGMGIMTARSGEEVMQINKKTRNKMDVIKEGTTSSEVIIQEGVPTVDRVEGHPAEPMMYVAGGRTVGGAYRVNEARDSTGNLNAAGMRFAGMCDEKESAAQPDKVKVTDCNFCVFSLLAELATLAAAREE